MSLLSAALIRTVAVVVVLPMVAAASAADLAVATHGRGFATGATPRESSHEEDGMIGPRDSTSHGAFLAPELASLKRVRIETRPPGDVRGQTIREDSRSVVLETEPGREQFALSKMGCRLEGRVASIDGSSVILLVKGRSVRIRRQDIVRLQVPRESTAGALVGGLLGAYAGAWVATNVPALRKAGGEGIGIGQLVLIVGAGLGGGTLGYGGWETFPLLGDGRVSLALRPTRRGGAVGLSLGF